MAIMFLVHQVIEKDKTTLGDVAFQQIRGLELKEVLDLIKSKDRTEIPVYWDLEDNLELKDLKVCYADITTPFINLCNSFNLADRMFLGKVVNLPDGEYFSEKGFKCYHINGVERLYYKDDEEYDSNVQKEIKLKSKYLRWEDLKKINSEGCLKVKLNSAEYELYFEKWSKYDDATSISLYLNEFCVMSIRLKTDYDKQFFNDLHLEVIK